MCTHIDINATSKSTSGLPLPRTSVFTVCPSPKNVQMDAKQLTSALKQSRVQLTKFAESQGNADILRMVDGAPLAPDHVKVLLEALDRSTAQFTAFQAVKDCLAEYLGTVAVLPVSSGALVLEEANIFTTVAADEALQALPHSLSNIITASLLTLVEERRVDCVHHLCGAKVQLLVVSAKPSRKTGSDKHPGAHTQSKHGHMVPQSRASGRMVPGTQERSGFLGGRLDRKPDIQEELDAMLARKSYLGNKPDGEAEQLLMQPSATPHRPPHGPRTRQAPTP